MDYTHTHTHAQTHIILCYVILNSDQIHILHWYILIFMKNTLTCKAYNFIEYLDIHTVILIFWHFKPMSHLIMKEKSWYWSSFGIEFGCLLSFIPLLLRELGRGNAPPLKPQLTWQCTYRDKGSMARFQLAKSPSTTFHFIFCTVKRNAGTGKQQEEWEEDMQKKAMSWNWTLADVNVGRSLNQLKLSGHCILFYTIYF